MEKTNAGKVKNITNELSDMSPIEQRMFLFSLMGSLEGIVDTDLFSESKVIERLEFALDFVKKSK